MKAYKNTTKVVRLGQSGTGKTSVITQYVRGIFTLGSYPTIGASFVTKTEIVNNENINISIWDTAGQELYRGLTPMYYRNAMAAIIIFDLTNNESFKAVNGWIDELRDNSPETLIAICGNKLDLPGRVVTREQGVQLAKSMDAHYFETSAATSEGVKELFHGIAELLVEKKGAIVRSNSAPTLYDVWNQDESKDNEKKPCC